MILIWKSIFVPFIKYNLFQNSSNQSNAMGGKIRMWTVLNWGPGHDVEGWWVAPCLRTQPIIMHYIIMTSILRISINLNIYSTETIHCQLICFIINSKYSERCCLEAGQPHEKWTRPFNAKCIRFPVVNCGKTLHWIQLKLSYLFETVHNLILGDMCTHFHENRLASIRTSQIDKFATIVVNSINASSIRSKLSQCN